MQIVIDISESIFNSAKHHYLASDISIPELLEEFTKALKNGTPLPKGHGRLIDADKTIAVAWQNFYKHENEWEKKDEDYLIIHRFYDQIGFECCQQTVVNAPTIIEADKEVE